FYIIAGIIGKAGINSYNAFGTIALRVFGCQYKFYFRVSGNRLKNASGVYCVGIQAAVIFVKNTYLIFNLCFADVLISILVDHMEHHGNFIDFALFTLLWTVFERFPSLESFFPSLGCFGVFNQVFFV